MLRPLTRRQQTILDFISLSTRQNGVPPTRREIANHFQITAGGLQRQIKALEAKGVLKRSAARTARGLQVVAGQKVAGQVRLPILGSVPAGTPVEAIENVENHLVLDRSLVKGADFILRVHGDSMEPDIVDGDLVLVKQAPDAESGERVVAHVGEDEATVKYLKRRGHQVWLEAANPRYKSISGRPIRIIGKVVGLLRNW